MGKPESKNLLIICGFRQILALTAAGALSPDVTNRLSRRTPGEPDVIKTSLENRTFGRLLSASCHSLGDCEPQEIAKVARPSFVNGTEIFADDGKALREYF
jgi:hypothetical protein